MILLAMVLLAARPDDSTVRLYEGLGPFHRPVQSQSKLASQFLDQGFAFLYGFQYGIAKESFKEAARLDPDMVMAYWGISAANGNYINKSFVSAQESKDAIEALTKAREHRSKGTPVENDLVEASFKRFAPDGPSDRHALDQAYSDAMREVWKKHPKDPDIGALFAESLMNLRPWHQWKLDGTAEPGTEEALATLRQVMKLDPKHPEALHLWIHAIEGSKNPERGLPEADKLMDLQPGLLHMQHMPAHIYDRTGQWKKAVEANVKSAAVYKRLFWQQGKGLDYAHGRHLLAYAAAMRGQSELAMQNVNQIFDGMTKEQIDAYGGGADYQVAMKAMFLVRFGRWDQVLALPEPPASQQFARAMWHESRGVAFAAKKDAKSARAEQEKFEALSKGSGERDLIAIASRVLAGEIATCEGDSNTGVAELEKAVALEDGLEYGEPPSWILPTRHTLGAILLDAGRFADAAAVFERDLGQHPNNGWALYGLYRAQEGLGKTKDAEKTLAAFKLAWADADMEISSSCMCLPGKKGGG
ncbi:MAG: tetratricopeptide repeat protein [Armatimonadetes bacterium]|nr:tetratricopeptide repeat protein [Armatimonadota bacterium]